MLFKKDKPAVTVTEVSLKKRYKFMYENFIVSSQQNLFLLLEKNDDKIDAIEFNFSIYKYGYPNDEIGHPLSQYGLGFYGIYIVHNSPWIEELRSLNSAHPRHDDSSYENRKHYVVKFKDVTLEVICHDMKEIQLSKEDLSAFVNTELSYLEP